MYMIEFPFTKIVRVYSTAYYRLKKSTADTQGGFPIMGHFPSTEFLGECHQPTEQTPMENPGGSRKEIWLGFRQLNGLQWH